MLPSRGLTTPFRKSSTASSSGSGSVTRPVLRRLRVSETILQMTIAIGLLTGPSQVWALANPALVRALRRREKDLKGKPIEETLPGPENEALIRSLDAVYRTGVAFRNREMKLVIQTGANGKTEETSWRFSCFPIRNRRGGIWRLLLFGWEVGADRRPTVEPGGQFPLAFEPRNEKPAAEWNLNPQRARNLSRMMQRARAEERARVARELHDSTGQLLAALSLSLSQASRLCSNEATAQKLREGLRLVDEMANEVHAISRSPRPQILDQAGLACAVSSLVQTFSTRSGIAVQMETAADLSGLTADQETAIFRVVQESLTNVQRHSQSPTATVQITRTASEICVEVRDHGKGFPSTARKAIAASANARHGIKGMRERIRLLGGRLEIQSSSRGVSLRAFLPVCDPAIAV